ncbi:MAG: carbonic anhydrase [Deltaproteobacteria bacterium]|nr:carbonic anhydrase [Deltaproteobacteria bacterium]
MTSKILRCLAAILCAASLLATGALASGDAGAKPSPQAALLLLQAGNARFVGGTPDHPHQSKLRLAQAGTEDQGKHAYATVLTCSDSRVPAEILFDAGVMDIFVIRVAGNVVKTDEAGSIEYGLAHVNTPVLVVLGHTQCGAVTAVTDEVEGHGHALERNIPPLVAPIIPAVQAAQKAHPDLHGKELVPQAIEANVWQGIRDLFMQSPATRQLVQDGKAMVVGAIYDVGTGKVSWLPQEKVGQILAQVEADPQRAMEAMAPGK